MSKTGFRVTMLALTLLLTACQERKQPDQSSALPAAGTPATPATPTTTPPPVGVDKWLGQWNGPEGTYLLISRNGEKYAVKIQSLDGPQTYAGVAAADGIQFERDGRMETIHPGNGKDTGMKWLMDKQDCLIIHSGEGFCRK